MEPIKEFHKVVMNLDNLAVPNERLLNTPSAKDGVSAQLEMDLRIVGCEYIQSVGLLLKLPQVAMATAQILFQRFYYTKSFVKYSIQPMAMACVFLAAKIEEDCRRLRDVINVFHHLRQKRMGRPIVPMEYMGEEYFKTKATVIKYERFLLKELGFCVHVKHPHKTIITYLQILEMEKNTTLAQKAWNFMNDGLKTNVFVRFSPETIACACIFLAARQLQIPLPQRPPWWLVFDTNYEDIEAISLEILALYSRPKRFLEDLEKEVAILREQLQKKHVEIKEVSVRKPGSTTVSSNTASPNTASPALAETRRSNQHERSTSKSPAPRPPLIATKPEIANLKPVPTTSEPSRSRDNSPLRNGEGKKLRSKVKSPQTLPGPRSRSPTPPQERHDSSSERRSRSHSKSRSRGHTPLAYKPIQSPIKMSSDSQSDHSYSPSPPPPPPPPPSNENGVPEHHHRDYENDYRVRKSRHKLRGERRERQGQRERSASQEWEHRRKHRKREREREREHGREHERERDRVRDYHRDRDRHKSHSRGRDSLRYR